MKRLRQSTGSSEHGFITMIVVMLLILAGAIFLAYLRVAKAQK